MAWSYYVMGGTAPSPPCAIGDGLHAYTTFDRAMSSWEQVSGLLRTGLSRNAFIALTLPNLGNVYSDWASSFTDEL